MCRNLLVVWGRCRRCTRWDNKATFLDLSFFSHKEDQEQLHSVVVRSGKSPKLILNLGLMWHQHLGGRGRRSFIGGQADTKGEQTLWVSQWGSRQEQGMCLQDSHRTLQWELSMAAGLSVRQFLWGTLGLGHRCLETSLQADITGSGLDGDHLKDLKF